MKWISVEEEYPVNTETVFITDGLDISTAHFFGMEDDENGNSVPRWANQFNHITGKYIEHPTHWMAVDDFLVWTMVTLETVKDVVWKSFDEESPQWFSLVVVHNSKDLVRARYLGSNEEGVLALNSIDDANEVDGQYTHWMYLAHYRAHEIFREQSKE